MADTILQAIEDHISQDPCSRGIGACFQRTHLVEAARRLHAADSIIITTGFYILRCKAPETDGPLGAYAIARALALLGKRVCLLTDALNADALRCCQIHGQVADGVEIGLEIFPDNIDPDAPRALSTTETEFGRRLFASWMPDCLLAIERLGAASDGHYYSMRAVDLSAHTARLDLLFESPVRDELAAAAGMARAPFTVGIGDGGNEIGMGRVHELVVRDVPRGETIGTRVATDWLIVTGVSNWAGYGLAAALAALSGRANLARQPAADLKLLDALLALGLVDGVLGESRRSVDGLMWESEHRAMLVRLLELIGASPESSAS